ncbi:MAG TPA: RpiB/LacA/LacB family sugar-phosphate isomerase [Candidatus Limnocylindrales bacterium]|nr:RpiB/LacA/LacB family sugar-phosphate isomerase [Candidatus Limnocylindrales bacterium]
MIYLAGDKQGYDAVKIVSDFLDSKRIYYQNLGVKSSSEDLKLEDMIPSVTKKVLEEENNIGILSCGSGIGVEVGANKFSGIRACLATNEKIAEWAKVYDNCNILCLVGWNPDKANIEKIVSAFLNSDYDGSEKRLKMFEEFNKWH